MQQAVQLGYWTIPVADVARAQAFFGGLFGWEYSDVRAGYAHIANVSPPMGLRKGEPARLGDHYFQVADIEAALERLRALGGHAEPPATSPSGIHAKCTDDQGTEFGLWQEAPGLAAPPDVRIYLVAGNAARALEFYRDAFGAEEITRWVDPTEGPHKGKIGHAEFRLSGQTFFIADGYGTLDAVKSPDQLGGVPLIVWLTVPDLEAALSRALAAGATLLEPIGTMNVDEGRRCRIADPVGYVWTLTARP